MDAMFSEDARTKMYLLVRVEGQETVEFPVGGKPFSDFKRACTAARDYYHDDQPTYSPQAVSVATGHVTERDELPAMLDGYIERRREEVMVHLVDPCLRSILRPLIAGKAADDSLIGEQLEDGVLVRFKATPEGQKAVEDLMALWRPMVAGLSNPTERLNVYRTEKQWCATALAGPVEATQR